MPSIVFRGAVKVCLGGNGKEKVRGASEAESDLPKSQLFLFGGLVV